MTPEAEAAHPSVPCAVCEGRGWLAADVHAERIAALAEAAHPSDRTAASLGLPRPMAWYKTGEDDHLVTGYLLSPAEIVAVVERAIEREAARLEPGVKRLAGYVTEARPDARATAHVYFPDQASMTPEHDGWTGSGETEDEAIVNLGAALAAEYDRLRASTIPDRTAE